MTPRWLHPVRRMSSPGLAPGRAAALCERNGGPAASLPVGVGRSWTLPPRPCSLSPRRSAGRGPGRGGPIQRFSGPLPTHEPGLGAPASRRHPETKAAGETPALPGFPPGFRGTKREPQRRVESLPSPRLHSKWKRGRREQCPDTPAGVSDFTEGFAPVGGAGGAWRTPRKFPCNRSPFPGVTEGVAMVRSISRA